MNDIASEANLKSEEVVAPAPGRDRSAHNFDLLSGVAVRLSVEVGSTKMRLSELVALSEGSIVELDRQANDLLDIFANGTLVARGEIVSVNGRYGIKVVEVVAPDNRLPGLDRRS